MRSRSETLTVQLNELRIRREITASWWLLCWQGFDGVVPVAMERVAFDVDGVHVGIGNLDTLGITAGVDVASDGEASIGRGGADQLDDDLMADERLAAPVLRNVGEQAMLNPVPFAGAGRQVGHRHGEAGFIGEAL